MQPLHELLHRIKWDKKFGRGTFALAYDDRTAGEEKRVPFTSISIDPGAFSFSLPDDDGDVVHIPLHRVRTVYKDGVIIWQRAKPSAPRRSTRSESS
jgi:uncharacterized protein (UPF0248 family)